MPHLLYIKLIGIISKTSLFCNTFLYFKIYKNKGSGENKDFSQDIQLQAIDKKGNIVEGVELSQVSVKANVTLLTKKEPKLFYLF